MAIHMLSVVSLVLGIIIWPTAGWPIDVCAASGAQNEDLLIAARSDNHVKLKELLKNGAFSPSS